MISKPEALIRMVEFKSAVKDSTGGQCKVKKRDYLQEGLIPIIDQGQSLVAGYTDDISAVFSGNLPVVLFGDHTLALKYVDYPFALGADGVKALSIHKTFNPKYLYYYWQFCQIQSQGYSRHFKFLREIKLPLIPISEQHRIVEILDQADALRKKRAEADAKAARILTALFYKMFGDPFSLMLESESIPLEQFDLDLQNGFACGQKDVEAGIPHLRMNNIDDAGVLNLDLIRTVPTEKDEKHYRLQAGDILFMGTNSEDKIGKTCVFFPPDDCHYLFSNHLIRIRISDDRINPEYLGTYLHLLWQKRFYPSIAKRWVNQAAIAQGTLAKIRVPVPNKQAISQFKRAFHELLLSRSRRSKSFKRLEDLLATLLHRAFTGDLTAQWREAHMQELLQEMDQQAKALSLES